MGHIVHRCRCFTLVLAHRNVPLSGTRALPAPVLDSFTRLIPRANPKANSAVDVIHTRICSVFVMTSPVVCHSHLPAVDVFVKMHLLLVPGAGFVGYDQEAWLLMAIIFAGGMSSLRLEEFMVLEVMELLMVLEVMEVNTTKPPSVSLLLVIVHVVL